MTEVRDLAATLARVQPFTMVGSDALLDLARMVRAALTFDIPGNFVECGVWRGGASFLMAELARQAGAHQRRVWLFDSFEGLPPPEAVDGPAALAYVEDTDSPTYYDNCRASLEDVRQTAAALGVADYTELVKGWFDQTLPLHRDRIGEIAILRIDGDWYSSVRCCLENLYDQVVDGGLVVLDDYYAYDGCTLAVHEFLGQRGLGYPLETVTGAPAGQPQCAVFRKGKSTWKWLEQVSLIRQEIATLVPSEATFILVDEQCLGNDVAAGRRAIPFLERGGEYWGPPPDDRTAIRELDRLRQSGASFAVFGWPAFWWLDHYAELHQYLRSQFGCLLENDRVIIFDLRRGGASQA
jgi:hypothetical protein